MISLEDIRDRENELAGNLSLNQELDHILTVNNWLTAAGEDHPFPKNRKIVEVRTLKMKRETAWNLTRTSKFDRSQRHMRKLHDEGRAVAEQWLKDWRAQGKNFDAYPNDARYSQRD